MPRRPRAAPTARRPDPALSLPRELAEVVGEGHVLTDPELTAGYERDWTGRFGARAALVVRPADGGELAEVVRRCAAAGVPIVPQGGNTGLVGGGVPRGGEAIVSLRRLDVIGPVDAALGQVTAGAGVTLAALQEAARRHGEDPTLDFAARDSCTLGGLVACDAGGARALRHGTARPHVAGLEAVLADGSVVSRLQGLTKDNAGYDLPALLIGSEGTLGIITRVRWRLAPMVPARATALVALDSVAAAARLLASLRDSAPTLESCDFFGPEGMSLVLSHQRRRSPLRTDAAVYLVLECAGRRDPTDELAAALDAAGAHDAVLADDAAGRAGLWALREGHADAINAAGIPHKLDVGVPLSELERFLAEVPPTAAAAGAERVIVFGHLGDGNVHVNLLGAPAEDRRADDAVLELALRCGGTISAEHGIGVAKADWLARARGDAELRAMRAVKHALDPGGLLNPGAVLALDQPSSSGPNVRPAVSSWIQ
ncbi:MAG: FAD-binding oxidoreductase [Solirubrobacterales bacterium]|nr:FAD-binding oxidoreductase [Solirubrobacterales bacterium]